MFQQLTMKAENGIRFEINQNENEILITANLYTHVNPIVPYGFEYVKGEWFNGFTIRNKADGSEFVWVPVGSLEDDATLDGRNFNVKFGRRCFGSDDQYKFVRLKDSFIIEKNLVKIKGGFYISAYLASKENGKLVFKKNMEPLIVKNLTEAEELAESYRLDGLITKLPSGAVYDSIFEWMGGDSNPQICSDSRRWGSFDGFTPKKTLTGSEKYCKYGIYDLSGNIGEISTERSEHHYIVRCYETDVAGRTYEYIDSEFSRVQNKGFRIALYVCDLDVSRKVIMKVV